MKADGVLICLYAFYPFENSNTNVMLPLIRALSNHYAVSILTGNNNNKAPAQEIMDGITVYRYKRQNWLIRMVQGFASIDNTKDRGLLKNAIVGIIRPISLQLTRFQVFQSSQTKKLSELLIKHEYALIISTCESFYSHWSVLQHKKEKGLTIPWIAYYMDPFAYYVGNVGNNQSLIARECSVYEHCDLAIVTQEIFEENKTNAFSRFLAKTRPVKYSNFRCIDYELLNPIFIEDKINCVYVGSLLDESVRNPTYLYRIINEMDDRFVFHIICNNFTRRNRKLRNQVLKKSANVLWYHNLPLIECLGIMSNADLLINLGNRSINQTPSKVFDYIGTGRPIINLYSLEMDTSKYYLRNYTNCINIREEESALGENIEAFVRFAQENLGKKVSRDELMEQYCDYLSEHVLQDTLELVHDMIGKRSFQD